MEKRLPESELELMLIVWQADQPITSSYIMERLQGNKTWGITTVLNLLTRLVDKGFLRCEKQGRLNVYTPLVDHNDYVTNESKSFLSRLHDNSLKSLVATLYNGNGISKKDLDELKQFIEEAE